MNPLVSIVMPSLNQGEFIEFAIDSVLEQDYSKIELIVADGGSSDNTLEILSHKKATDPRLRWFSKKDNGPAQAINSALDNVRGTIIGWLNADDLYVPGAISRAVDAFNSHPNWLMVYGQGEHIDIRGKRLNRYPTLPPETPIAQFQKGCFICQPTVFFRRTFYILIGKMNESLKTAFDFDYWLRAFHLIPQRIGFIDALQAQSRLHSNCITLRQRRDVILEGMQVLSRFFGKAPKEWVITYINELKATSMSNEDVLRHAFRFLDDAREMLCANEFNELVNLLSMFNDQS